MAHALPSLTYDYAALEPFVDATTMNIHHTKHHQAYINNLNTALDKHSELKSLSLEELNIKVTTLPEDVRTAIRNNGGGHWNHTMFWKWMAPVGSVNHAPIGSLKAAIDKDFGSFDVLKEKFNAAAAARFGSGWAWLGVKEDGSLGITSTPNQDNPMMDGVADVKMTPILGLDVWEHAYYLKYQNRRADYLASWWNIVNFDTVVELYDAQAKK
eukprot:CAMPEP_0113705560 /NCGR_PEP_ID=MMETSP0038_2-20120614/27205_1 /TAXON_ID=2898 /ORGANISM="Cryptomonas paramecium" /LENGTH=212 /DNA_ID=CAMNT_0000630591 /DNA_START=20 /DNA_END=658 /DNA_ORIENTATION=- /assembly_acc=CAM_ASM_000170